MRLWKFWRKPQIRTLEDVKTLPRDVRLDQVERMMGGLPAKCDHPTLLFFTVYKAASSYVAGMLMRLSIIQQLNHIDYEEYLNSEKTDFLQHNSRQILRSVILDGPRDDMKFDREFGSHRGFELSRLFPKNGFQFGPIRNSRLLTELPDLDQYRILVQLRDPRDCITSMYFSKVYSHVPPRNPRMLKRFVEERRKASEESIDEYAVSIAPWWLTVCQSYADAVRNLPGLHLVKYEEMVLDFPNWLEKVEQAWNLPIDPGLRQQLINQTDFNVQQENVNSHKRQVLPGDHLRKLKPDTIRQLTDMFGPVMETLGYPPEANYSRAA